MNRYKVRKSDGEFPQRWGVGKVRAYFFYVYIPST